MNEKEVIDMIIEKLAIFILDESQQKLLDNGTSDTGYLLRSSKIQKEGENWNIHYDAPYAAAIEFGTKPHGVNPKNLEGWIRRKLGVKDEKEIKKISFLISNAIKKRGTKPQPFISPAIEKARMNFRGI